MSGLSKRKRSNNFSFSEKELLLKIALSRKTVLENKLSNAVTWKDKEKTWGEIAEQYNKPITRICKNTSYFCTIGN